MTRKIYLPSAVKPSSYEPEGTYKYIDSHLKGIDEKFKTVRELIDAEAAIPTAVTIPTDPTGGTTTDTQARTAINGINDALGEIETALGAIVAALVAHGIVEEE